MNLIEPPQTYCPEPRLIIQDTRSKKATTGTFELFRPPQGVWCHHLAIIMAPYDPGNNMVGTDTYNLKAAVEFSLGGKPTSSYPAVFCTDANVGLQLCMFPNTVNALGISNNSILLSGWGGTSPIFLLPRRIIAGCDRISLNVDTAKLPDTTYGWRAYVSIASSNKFF